MKDFEKLSTIFKALGESNRMKIFSHLCSCTRAKVNDVQDCCGVDISVISRHLKNLKEAGLLKSEKEGKQVFYSVDGVELVAGLRSLADKIEECCKNSSHCKEA